MSLSPSELCETLMFKSFKRGNQADNPTPPHDTQCPHLFTTTTRTTKAAGEKQQNNLTL